MSIVLILIYLVCTKKMYRCQLCSIICWHVWKSSIVQLFFSMKQASVSGADCCATNCKVEQSMHTSYLFACSEISSRSCKFDMW